MASKNNSGGVIGLLISLIIGVVMLFVMIIKRIFSCYKRKKQIEFSSQLCVEYSDTPIDYSYSTFSSYVAGARYHCPMRDASFFKGIAIHDPDNSYNSKAIAIYKIDGPLLGYVPEKDLKEYWEWSEGKNMPCVGYIQINGDDFRTNVKFIYPFNKEFVDKETEEYYEWWNERK